MASIQDRYRDVRAKTLSICDPLTHEDMLAQTMADVSPARWHIAHTTWFFDTFVLNGTTRPDGWDYLFNSYYNGAGPQFPRDRRGTQTRPTVAEILAWRTQVDDAVLHALDDPGLHQIVEVGTHHEQQHQELMLTDIKHVLFSNPLGPKYHVSDWAPTTPTPVLWKAFESGVQEVGHAGKSFAFDNESPRHRVFLEPFEIASRPVNNSEFLGFVKDGGYERADLWFAEAWTTVSAQKWRHPKYWREGETGWQEWTLSGWRPLDLGAPASHISLWEADAYAHWAKARLPTEFEWEVAFGETAPIAASLHLHPQQRRDWEASDVWEWTSSAYGPYPGFKPWSGVLGEYNGKFMLNQYVLRGGSCATSPDHMRPTYRNFFPAYARWQFSGFRLVKGA